LPSIFSSLVLSLPIDSESSLNFDLVIMLFILMMFGSSYLSDYLEDGLHDKGLVTFLYSSSASSLSGTNYLILLMLNLLANTSWNVFRNLASFAILSMNEVPFLSPFYFKKTLYLSFIKGSFIVSKSSMNYLLAFSTLTF
jgi:hypothetical protein